MTPLKKVKDGTCSDMQWGAHPQSLFSFGGKEISLDICGNAGGKCGWNCLFFLLNLSTSRAIANIYRPSFKTSNAKGLIVTLIFFNGVPFSLGLFRDLAKLGEGSSKTSQLQRSRSAEIKNIYTISTLNARSENFRVKHIISQQPDYPNPSSSSSARLWLLSAGGARPARASRTLGAHSQTLPNIFLTITFAYFCHS